MTRHANHQNPAKAPSQRQLRVGEELRHAIAHIIEHGDLRDPDLVGVSVTVTEVRVSPDLKNATAFVMPLGGVNAGPIVKALQRARPFIRRQVAGMVNLRYAPDIKFEEDASFDEARRIDDLLREVLPHEQGAEDESGKD